MTRRLPVDQLTVAQPGRFSLAERVAFKTDSSGGPDSCWPWTGTKNRYGYGRFRADGREMNAHRAAWIAERGQIGEGLVVCHRCDNPACCNPTHLFLGTVADNNADMTAKRRNRRGERHQNAKLTDAQVIAARGDRRSGRAVAREYGVAPETIYKIRRGIRQTNLEEG